MSVAERKRRMWEEREQLILHEAHALLRQHGYLGLNLNDLAARIDYAKGTIYQHFATKEDLIAGLIASRKGAFIDQIAKAARYPGPSRHRFQAIGEVADRMAMTHGDLLGAQALIEQPSMWEKVSETWQQRLRDLPRRLAEGMGEVVRMAIAAGDLPAADPALVADLVHGVSALQLGTETLARQSGSDRDPAGQPWFGVGSMLRRNQHRLLDAVGWRPLSADHDTVAVSVAIHAYFGWPHHVPAPAAVAALT